ncbi:methyl-accepting chemotaxis protein [Bradyrhizobium sp. BRP20]|uniref:methyl-accepting chemotaxis protein n=1 Tax=Bradyrhizobium sp. BRP20 TaxID=2793822 RepID=UPI001CD58A7C|nr:methyl-accepting chemotaxis protein [Bradyrhizobium sp. BRP20]MCA1438037.1 methyl-accepting chemotaxis protein [Bradyrhizobium sp. BRP20]
MAGVAGPARISFIAIRAMEDRSDGPLEAVVIGTNDLDGTDWRYVCYDLAVFKNLLRDRDNPFAPKNPLYAANARYHDGSDANDPHLGHVAVDDDQDPTPPTSAIELRGIALFTAYRAPTNYAAEKDPVKRQQKAWDVFDEGPLARFDTIALARTLADKPAPRWQVSKLVITPATGKPGNFKALAIRLQVRLALNGHWIRPKVATSGDRYDTRFHVGLDVVQATTTQSLWKIAAAPRGALCRLIQIALTIGPWDRGEPALSIVPLRYADSDFIDAIVKPDDGNLSTDQVDVIPLFVDQGIPSQPPNRPRREFGLRAVEHQFNKDTGSHDIIRVALRFELTLWNYSGKIGSILKRFFSKPELLPVKGRVRFSQEQRVGDIGARGLKPLLPVQWIVAARLDPLNVDPKSDPKLRRPDQITDFVIDAFDVVIEDEHDSLRKVRDGTPLSVMPALAKRKSERGMPWHAVGLLRENYAWRRVIVPTTGTVKDAADKRRQTAFLSFEPRFIPDMWQGVTAFELVEKGKSDEDPRFASPCTATFARMIATEGTAPVCKARISAPFVAASTDVQPGACTDGPAWQPAITQTDDLGTVPTIKFGFSLESTDGSEIALGALGFSLLKAPDLTMVTKADLTGLLARSGGDELPDAQLQAVVKFPIERVKPIGQDDLPPQIRRQLLGRPTPISDDPDEPLLLELDYRSGSEQPDDEKLIQALVATESLAPGENQSVSLSLRAIRSMTTTSAAPKRLALVIDPTPFRVAAVEYVEPARAATDQSNEVAIWSDEGDVSWRVLDPSEAVRMVLPPQVIGEAMEKNATAIAGAPKDIEPGRPAAARFGAHARLEVDPTFADTNFREPGWNLRRNMGYPTMRTPGSRLKELRLELLYGLTTRISTTDKSTDAFVTEIGATIGAPVSPLSDTASASRATLKSHLQLAGLVLRAQRRRLAVDKLWSGHPDAELKIEDGVSFRLRTGGSDPAHGPATPLRWPVQGEIPADTGGLIESKKLARTFSTSQDDRESFPGGVAWAFESANILMKVYSRPDADGGSAKGIHLSAHGGYGGQRALFDEKKTVVETETGQGRVHRYKLERIGRIGGLWNRAKHVIIYERSVVPSAQFFNFDPIGVLQDEHAGRPILRKVEEYVELLQPVRRYPEDGKSIAAAGFLVGVEFKSGKIRVDSRWGGDVRREGWQVPLWNKAFASLPPVLAPARPGDPPINPDDPSLIYPKPQIRFLLAGEGGGEISVEVDEPEKLVFYTSVVDGESGDDTDAWRSVRDIDFIDLPPPAAGRMKPNSANLTDAMMPSEPAHAPGFERMTIGLVRAKEPAVLTHGRAPSGPGTILKNITIARAAPLTAVGAPSPLTTFGQSLTQHSSDLRAAIDAKVGQALGVLEKLDPEKPLADVKNDAVAAIGAALSHPSFVGDLRSATSDVKNSLKSIDLSKIDPKSPCASLADRLNDAAQGQVERLRKIAGEAIDSTLDGGLRPIRNIAGIVRDVSVFLDSEDAWLSPDERADLIDKLSGLQNRIATIADERRADIELLSKRVTADLEAIKAVAGASLGEAQDVAIPAALGKIHDTFKTLKDDVGAATVVNDLIAASARATLDELRKQAQQIDTELSHIDDTAALMAARRILPAIHDTLGQAITLADGLTHVGAAISDDVRTALASYEASLKQFEDALKARLGTAGGSLQALATKLDQIIAEAQNAARGLVVFLEDTIDAGLAEATSIFDRIADAIIALSAPEDPDDDADSTGAIHRALTAIADTSGLIEKAVVAQGEIVATVLRKTLDALAAGITAAIVDVGKELKDACAVFDNFIGEIRKDAQKVADWLQNALDVDGYKKRLDDAVKQAINDAQGSIEDLKRRAAEEAERVTREVENRARQISGAVQETLRDALGTDPVKLADQANRLYQEGSDTLRLLRAVGDPPQTDRLGFNRPEVAYVLAEANKVVDMTPAIALVNRVSDTLAAADKAGKAVGDMLQSFGVRLPSSGVAEQFIPDKLKQLSVADLIPNMGGIDFRGLLQRFAFPDLDDSKAIKVQHGFDNVQMRAWLQTDIDVPFTEPAPLLSFGPVEIVVDEAKFNAKARMSVGRDGTQKTFNGRIFGDWRVVTGGQDILTFRQTGLYFDDSGKIDFKIDPERVELADALAFLTDFLAASGEGDGLVIEPLMRGGVPAGIAATLDIDLPDLQLGVFGISNLSLHILFGIAAVPQFELMCELSVATKTMPFTLSVWILNGGGFLTQRLSFLPVAKPHPILTYSLEVGIVAGVGLGFNFGVVSGGVWLQVGCSITMTWSTGAGGNTTAISVFILARGNVDVAGLITAAISLLLEVTYDGALMIGSGTLRLSFKISVFYTLRVSQHVEYQFAGEKKQSEGYSDSYA